MRTSGGGAAWRAATTAALSARHPAAARAGQRRRLRHLERRAPHDARRAHLGVALRHERDVARRPRRHIGAHRAAAATSASSAVLASADGQRDIVFSVSV